MATPTLVAPTQGVRHEMIDGTHVVKAGAEVTRGAYEVFEVEARRQPPAPPHASPWTATLHVLDGLVRVHADGTTTDLAPGATFTAPAGTAYTFEVVSETARFLAITSGDAAGRFFADFAASVPPDASIEDAIPHLLAVTARHGVRIG